MSMNSEVDTAETRRRRNRLWPEALKREIVAASFEPGASVSVVARRYDINTNQLFAWRKLYRSGDGMSPGPIGPVLLPVTITAEPGTPAATTLLKTNASDTIEIELGDKYRVRVGSGVDGEALRRVLDALERRPVRGSLGEGGSVDRSPGEGR
jgi:transposase